MKKIVKHPNYKQMPWAIDTSQKIRWNAPSHRPPGGPWSNLHDERFHWWKTKAIQIKIPLTGSWISKVAKEIHPFKKKPCQTCGVERSLLYEYPTVRILQKINKINGISIPFEYRDFLTIVQIVEEVHKQTGIKGIEELCIILGIPKKYSKSLKILRKYITNFILAEPKGVLSPGAMSNAPDRLDGFHTYNICCRSTEDTGRHKKNLKTYGLDRRAFEFWCEGDWSAASRLMKEEVVGKCAYCGNKQELTADHIGPISLGFCHRPKFNALCRGCNSAKNNRMSRSDVRILLADEKSGSIVVSWNAKNVWDLLKMSIKNDEDALRISKIMRANQHHYLMMLSKIKESGHIEFLITLLHSEYAQNRYTIVRFNKSDFSYKKMLVQRRQTTYSDSLERRMKRISLDALDDYSSKTNRNPLLIQDKELTEIEGEMMKLLQNKKYSSAKIKFRKYMDLVGEKLVKFGIPRAYMMKGKKKN